MRVSLLFLSLMMGLFLKSLGSAKDLGRFGTVFPILEKDMEDEIKDRLSRAKKDGRLASFQASLKKDFESHVKTPKPVSFLKKVAKEREFKVDPSIVLDTDIKVPRDDGSIVTLGRKGDRINPLDYTRFETPLVFLDGDNEAQRDFAKDLVLKNPNTKCLLVKGSPGFDKDRKIFFYFDQSGVYSKRFQIQGTPSFVTQKPNERVLTIHEIFLDEKDRTEKNKSFEGTL